MTTFTIPDLPPGYSVHERDDGRPYAAHNHRTIEWNLPGVYRMWFHSREDAMVMCWRHWAGNGEAVWVKLLDSLIAAYPCPAHGLRELAKAIDRAGIVAFNAYAEDPSMTFYRFVHEGESLT